MAVGAFLIVSIARQQHADMHLVGFGFKPLEEMFYAIPLRTPFAIPTGFAMDNPVFFFLCEFFKRDIQANTVTSGIALHIRQTVLVGGRVPRFDCTLGE